MKNTVTFRLINGKKQGSYSLKGGMAKDHEGVMKNINYYPGSGSIFDEDNRDTAISPEIVTFKCNNNVSDLAVELIVDKSNKTLIDYLKARKEFGRIYDVYDKEGVSLKKVESYDLIQRALELVSESDDFKAEAVGLAILGFEHYGRPVIMIKAELKEMAIQRPESIISAFEDEAYESRFIASLAFSKKIIKSDITRSSVQWADTESKIINVAPGENPIEKLSQFIRLGSSESNTLLQEIGRRLKLDQGNRDLMPLSGSDKKEDPEKEAMRKRIEALEAQLSQAESKSNEAEPEEKEEFLDLDLGLGEESDSEAESEEVKISDAQERYFVKFGKEVPNNMKNNLGWILSRLSEH